MLKQIFSSEFIPHGHCYLWKPELVGLHLLSDSLIAIAYFSIAGMLLYFISKRKNVPFSRIFCLFGAFIIFCGAGHLMEVWTLWHPFYWLLGIEKALTAFVSCYTALQMGTILPQFLSLKSPEELEKINQELEKEIVKRQAVEAKLRVANQFLETRVQQRTGELSTALENLENEIEKRQEAILSLAESAQRERVIASVVEKIRQSLNIETIFKTTTEELRQTIKCDRVGIYQFNSDWSGEFVAESVGSNWSVLVQEQEKDPSLKENLLESENCQVKDLDDSNLVVDTYLQTEQGGIYSQGTKYRVVENIYEAGFTDCYLELLERFEAKAYITVPVIYGEKLWGLLACYQNSAPRQWKTVEINIVLQIGSQLGVALQQAGLLAKSQKQSLILEKALVAADAANCAKSEFIASMSHELRTPLNAIIGFTQLMNYDSSLSTKHREYVEIVNQAGEHLLKLINGILEMSKIEAGKITLEITRFDLFALIKSVEQMFSLKASTKNLQLISEWDIDVPQYIETDEGKLRQVLINLVGNGIKFTETGGIALLVRRTTDKNYLELEVSDTGLGIAPEEIDKLFQAFEQTETGRKSQEGTGLGLAISQQFIQLMGGDISVSSTVGLGTKFIFNIEIGSNDLSETNNSEVQKIVGLAPAQPEYRILVMEASKVNSLLLLKMLSHMGFNVQEATNINHLIPMCESWKPHLILIDMEILVMNDREVIKYLKTDSNYQKIVVFALTSRNFKYTSNEILSTGCDDFIVRPFSETIMLEKIAQHLEVQYIYEQVDELKNLPIEQSQNLPHQNTLTLEMLESMPIEWLTDLHQSAIELDSDWMFDLIQDIPKSHSDLSKVLTDYVNRFDYEQIVILTEQIIY